MQSCHSAIDPDESVAAAFRDAVQAQAPLREAAFIGSSQASGMTGTTVNLTMGSLDD